MSWTFRPTYTADGSGIVELFGQLVFSGFYKQGGDTGTFDFVTKATNGFSLYRKARSLPASRPPILADVVIQGLFLPILIPGVSATDFKILIFVLTTVQELASAAYPSNILTIPFHTLSIAYPRL
jgi:hypothetical protein